MIWSSISSSERLYLWKKLREDINESPLEIQLSEIAKFCSSMPYERRTIDYYSPQDWPTPWEILFHGSFCTSSISLLMFYTIVLLDPLASIELFLVEDDDGVFLLPVIQNQFVLNYELGKVSKYLDVIDKVKVLKQHPRDSVKIIK